MKTNIYIDGFNLYYGVIKATPYRWLNLHEFCRQMLPEGYQIHQIKYFTAPVKARPQDPDQPLRQQIYWRALETLPMLTIIKGHFLSHRVYMRLANPQPGIPDPIEVIKTEEKGSDVNLATHLLWDGVKENYEAAVVVSNDSDLLEPIKIIRYELGKEVGILNPHKHPSQELLKHACFLRTIRKNTLLRCQFPPELQDAHGIIRKPDAW